MSKEKQVAESILALVGGKENILSVEHCATRLRLVLKDATRFQKNEIEKIESVKGSFYLQDSIRLYLVLVLSIRFIHNLWNFVISVRENYCPNEMPHI